jgi:hypothetical protein
MNVYGLRLRLHPDPETGAPPEYHPWAQDLEPGADGKIGTVNFWQHQASGKLDDPGHYVLKICTQWRCFPPFGHPLMDPGRFPEPLQYDPTCDVWTAPEWVELLGLVTCTEPERVHELRPRPESWRPQ